MSHTSIVDFWIPCLTSVRLRVCVKQTEKTLESPTSSSTIGIALLLIYSVSSFLIKFLFSKQTMQTRDNRSHPATAFPVIWLHHLKKKNSVACCQTRTSACTTPPGGAFTYDEQWRLVTWVGVCWTSASPLTHNMCSTPAGLTTVSQGDL